MEKEILTQKYKKTIAFFLFLLEDWSSRIEPPKDEKFQWVLNQRD